MLSPEVVYGFEVKWGDELDFGKEDIASFLGGFSGEDDEEAAGFFVGLSEVLGGEVVLEEVKGGCGGFLGSYGGGCSACTTAGGGESKCYCR